MEPPALSIHSLRAGMRHGRTGMVLALAASPLVVAWYEFAPDAPRGIAMMSIGVVLAILQTALLAVMASRSYFGYLWAKRNGVFTGPVQYEKRLVLIPVTVGVPVILVGIGFLYRIDPILLLVILNPFICLATVRGWFWPGSQPLGRQLDDLVRAHVPDLPVFDANLSHIPHDSNFAYRVLIAKAMQDEPFLRGLLEHAGVKTVRFLPSWGLRELLAAEFPRLRPILGVGASDLTVEARAESLEAVVRKGLPDGRGDWHGVLDDGTDVVRHDGTYRLIPANPERFDAYHNMLKKHGPAMGFDRFYVQSGYATVLEPCYGCETEVYEFSRGWDAYERNSNAGEGAESRTAP